MITQMQYMQGARRINLLNMELWSLLIKRGRGSKKLNKKIKEDADQAWKENEETDKELRALLDTDSVEYAIRNQIPF